MEGKEQPIAPDSLLTVHDVLAWYKANPWPLRPVDALMPLENSDVDYWKTIGNAVYEQNVAADPLSSGSSIAVDGRDGFETVQGGMVEFGKGREMTSKDMEKFVKLKKQFSATKNPAIAAQLVKMYGDDLAYVRSTVQAERVYLTYALLSSACNLAFTTANSPYAASISNVTYPIAAWQKDAVSTSWANSSADILDDIQGVIDVADANGRTLTKIKINKKWFTYVRQNDQIKAQCISLVADLVGAKTNPSLATINAMLSEYFEQDLAFEVVNEKITRIGTDGAKTTANPFADGTAVFTVTTQVGRFVWNPIYIDSPDKETYESFFLVGNYKKVDPSYSKTYSKARAFPVVDTFADNFYLKIDAVAWS